VLKKERSAIRKLIDFQPFSNDQIYFLNDCFSCWKRIDWIFPQPLRNSNPRTPVQCCQMVYFQTENPNLGKFWKVLQWKMFGIFRAILSISRPTGIFYGHLVHFVVIWYIFTRFGMLYREKSGNPASVHDPHILILF
jgi:hypothetical protein